jgi:hypothetical protein
MDRYQTNQASFLCGNQVFQVPLALIPSSSPLKLNRGQQTIIDGNPLVFQVLVEYLNTGILRVPSDLFDEELVYKMARDYGIPLHCNKIDWRAEHVIIDGRNKNNPEERQSQMQIYKQLEHLVFKAILPFVTGKLEEYQDQHGIHGSSMTSLTSMLELSILLLPKGFTLQDLAPHSLLIETFCVDQEHSARLLNVGSVKGHSDRLSTPMTRLDNSIPSMSFLLHAPVKELLLRIMYQLFPSASKINVLVRTVSRRSENEFGLIESVSTPGLQILMEFA